MNAEFDREALLARVEGDEELLGEIVALFLEDCPRRLAEIREAIQGGSAEQLKMAAHTLKGSVGNFGAQHAYGLSFQLEQMGGKGEFEGAKEKLADLETAISLLRTDLLEFVPQTSNS